MSRSTSALDRIAALPRWSPDDARTVLAALEASGLSVTAFAARHNIQAQRLFLWRRKFREVPRPAPAFVEVTAPASTPSPLPRYELVLGDGRVLRVEGAFDPPAVRALIALLREARSC
jgi:transposase-like protein